MFSSYAHSSYSFFGKIKTRAYVNYDRNKQLIEAPTQLISNTFGAAVSSVILNGVGTAVDQYWQPTENFPPLFATIGLALGLLASSPKCLIKYTAIPINILVALTDAFGEELVIAMSDFSNDFKIGFNYCNDVLFFRYIEEDVFGNVEEKEMETKPSQFLGIIMGGLFGPRYMPEIFHKIANFAVPFASKIGFMTESLIAPLSSVAGYFFSRPAAKTLAFTGGLLTMPFARLYRCAKRQSKEEPVNSPGKMIEDEEYQPLAINGSRPLRSHTAS